MPKKANNSPKKNNDDSLLGLTDIQKAQKGKEKYDKWTAERHDDPNWIAVTVREDNKTMRLKWIKTDKINKEIGL